jgi:hypothetical protein
MMVSSERPRILSAAQSVKISGEAKYVEAQVFVNT